MARDASGHCANRTGGFVLPLSRRRVFLFRNAGNGRNLGNNNNNGTRQFPMRKPNLIILSLCAFSLAGCMADPASRGLAGALAGAAVADLTDNSVATGAVIGGLAGAATCGVNVGLPACY